MPREMPALLACFLLAGCTARAPRVEGPTSPNAKPAGKASTVDCAEAYRSGRQAKCRVVACDTRYASFIGEWIGPFEAFVRQLSKPDKPRFRPYQNRVTYAANDCLRNVDNGDSFIIGRRTDTYPPFEGLAAQTKRSLLITGRRADGRPFLRTIDSEGVYDYALESQQSAKEASVWRLDIPAARRPCPTEKEPKKSCATPEMEFRIVDKRDLTRNPANVRNVTVEMRLGPADQPYWHGVIARGHHDRR